MNIERKRQRWRVSALAYYHANKEKCKSRMKARAEKIKLQVFAVYSEGVVKCRRCEESDIRILNLDHIHGGGRKHSAICKKKESVFTQT